MGSPDRGALRQLDDAEVRAHQLGVLDVFSEHCRTHDITYYLCAGTLLGAIRHKGFIPWDDDIDVMLPRPDYERLCETWRNAEKGNRFTLRSVDSDSSYELPFAKISDDSTVLDVESGIVGDIGVYIDVFPLDSWHRIGVRRRLQQLCLRGLYKLVQLKAPARRRKRGALQEVVIKVASLLAAIVPGRSLAKALTRVARGPGYEHGSDVGVIVWGYREVVPRSSYGRGSTVEFEGRQMPAPDDPDDVLRRIYGDYMTPPPEGQRVTHHRSFTAFVRG